MARDNPSHESSQDRNKPVKHQGREAGARKAERERVRSGLRRMKRRTGNPEPQTKPQKGDRPPGRKHEQPASKPGQQAQGRSAH